MGLLAGARLAGYEILASLGAGGMGEVYLARDEYLGREVAIKMLPAHRQHDSAAIDRFFREARAASALNHPHIVTVHSAGTVDAGHFIVMELVRGQTLRGLIGQNVQVQTLRELTSQIARALAAAHQAGIVHRDIKPENIMVRDDGYVKVLDFGIARLEPHLWQTTEITGSVTQRIVGTPQYLSPERSRAMAGDAATDIFSLGIVLYELATGRHPFAAPSPYEVVLSILTDEPVSPSRLNPEIPADLDALILRMLAKEPALRPSAAEIATQVASGVPIGHAPVIRRIAAPRMVGRSREQAELRETFARSAAGHGVMICVTGEPGIGKSTLVENFLAELAQAREPCRIARGRCSERLAGSEAYLPILDALDDLIRAGGADGSSMARLLKTVAPLWYAQVSSLSTDALATVRSTPSAASSRERLKRELATFLDEASRTQPLLLFFDDVHWADVSTVDLLGYIGSRFGAMKILVVVTYRPEELLREKHSFLRVQQELRSRGSCFELALGFLTTTDVEAYLDLEFRDHGFPPTFARLLHEKTEGNPLFMVDLLRYLRDRGVLSKEAGSWTLSQAVPDVARSLPESVRSMIERKIDLLDEQDRRLLLAASVQGYQFDAAVVAHAVGMDPADVEERLDRLDRIHAFVHAGGEHEFPDHTMTVRYRFVHVLYQNLLFATLTHARRVALARAVAEKLETAYGAHVTSIAVEMAVLCTVARNFSKAADYYLTGARHATRVFGYQEAVLLAERGLESLAALPEDPERKRRELTLLFALGTPSVAAKGFAHPAVEQTYNRARTLCVELNETSQLFRVLRGLFGYHLVALQLDQASELADRMFQLATDLNDRAQLIESQNALAWVHNFWGDFVTARELLHRSVTLYDSETHHPASVSFGLDFGTTARGLLASVLWTLGLPDQAVDEIRLALQVARRLAHADTLAYALFYAVVIHQFRGEWNDARPYGEELLAITTEKGLAHYRAAAHAFLALDFAQQGELEEAIDRMRKGIEMYRAAGAQTSRPRFRAQLAELLGRAGRIEEGLAVIDDEIAACGAARFHLSELHRVRADLLLLGGGDASVADAGTHLATAIELARSQQAKSFELRAAMSLYRCSQRHGDQANARTILSDTLSWFTEGFETGDLKEASLLLASAR
jgi:tRNA A-37 threonylcarbamoyl transferase component Bud32/tetratricopeptide (TPR) repeat protein